MIPEEQQETFERNLEKFKTFLPNIYELLAAIDDTHSQLVFDENGSVNIEFRGQRLYPEASNSDEATKQALHKLNQSERIFLAPPQTCNMDDVGSEFNYNVIRKSVDLGAEFLIEPQGHETFNLAVFGIGLGQHIMPLALETNCLGLVLVEPNIEFLYHSLYITDWIEIFNRFSGPEDGRYMTILIESNPLNTTQLILSFIRGMNPPFADGATLFNHYPSAILDEAKRLFIKEAPMVVTGLGFYIDEEIMIRNSYNNLKNYQSYIFKNSDQRVNPPIFIIASGPSLSQSIEFIKENQDNAIVISCGTALKPILSNGIRPDFHVEIENVEAVIDVIKTTAKEHDTSGITLVASTTMQPDAVQVFDTTVLFFRQSLASNPIFSMGPDFQLSEVSPTVTNTALAFAQQIGGKEFYFFGMDYGSRRADEMHIKGTQYDTGRIPYNHNFDIKYKANFGGHVYTSSILNWARNVAERSIRRFQMGHTYYNCSDGCYLERAIPRLPRSLKPLVNIDKKKAIESIFNNFQTYSSDIFDAHWDRCLWKEETIQLCDDIIAILEEEQSDDTYWARFIERIARIIITPDLETTTSMFMIRGSLFLMFMTAVYYPPRVPDPKLRKETIVIIRAEMIKSILKIKERVNLFFDELEDGPSKKDNE